MNYEKKYREALERAKHYTWYSTNRSDTAEPIKNAVEAIFPELRDSEDEKTRKAILELVKQSSAILSPMNQNSMIAWLEKQGEKTIPKSIDDAALQYVDTCAVDGKFTHGNITEPCWNNHSMMAAYKAGWLEKQDEKPSWSEEDEYQINTILHGIDLKRELYKKEGNKVEEERYSTQYDWLKSLKPNRWKPSEQNIKDLEWCADLVKDKMGVRFHRLQVFIDELKKL